MVAEKCVQNLTQEEELKAVGHYQSFQARYDKKDKLRDLVDNSEKKVEDVELERDLAKFCLQQM